MPQVRERTTKYIPGSTEFLTRRECIWVSTTDTTTKDDADLVAVERAVNGLEPLPHLTRAEQRLAVHAMWKAGIPYTAMAYRAGLLERTVARWVAKERQALDLSPHAQED
ncbi:hypothetical protein BX265_6137 [Streptomyces sp. TLI_235]|nr:hypothetical protein [Streptomyces sp. TLI_235]PBC71527.1 hypothetical protein BX265_6137 [Streptomyces sp. TLI_235]